MKAEIERLNKNLERFFELTEPFSARPERTYPISDFAELIGVTPTDVRMMIRNGLPTVRYDGKHRILVSAYNNWLDKNTASVNKIRYERAPQPISTTKVGAKIKKVM